MSGIKAVQVVAGPAGAFGVTSKPATGAPGLDGVSGVRSPSPGRSPFAPRVFRIDSAKPPSKALEQARLRGVMHDKPRAL
jgi:hypothetical protein